MIGGTPDYITYAPMKCVGCEYDSRQGVLTATYICWGAMRQMQEDRAASEYIPATDTKPSELIDLFLTGSGAPYNGGGVTAWTTDWTGVTKATAIDFFLPSGGYKVNANTNRLSALRQILDNSYVFMRHEADGNIHLLKPVTTGTTYDYEYHLDDVHTFFQKTDIRLTTYPAAVTVYGGLWDDDTSAYQYHGHSGGGTANYFVQFESLVSDAECATLALAIFTNILINKKTCDAVVPMNCTAQLFDYCKITDDREGSWLAGTVGYIKRTFESGTFRMQIKFGGWQSERAMNEMLAGSKRPYQETARQWVTVSLPEVTIAAAASVTMQVLHLANGREMFIKAFGVYSGGSVLVKLKVTHGGGEDWSVMSDIYQKLFNEERVYWNDTGSDEDVTISVENTDVDSYNVTSFLTFAVT
jgi:hypothetical protein